MKIKCFINLFLFVLNTHVDIILEDVLHGYGEININFKFIVEFFTNIKKINK